MSCTTFLHNSELNVPLPYPDVQEVLEDVRKLTGQNWQVVPINITTKKWYKTTHETFYGLYVYIGGIGPWQQINFFNHKSKSSINLYVTIEEISAFLMGIRAGIDFSKKEKG